MTNVLIYVMRSLRNYSQPTKLFKEIQTHDKVLVATKDGMVEEYFIINPFSIFQ